MKRRVLALFIVLAVVLTAAALASGIDTVTNGDGVFKSAGPIVDSVANLFQNQSVSQAEIDNKRNELQAELAIKEIEIWTRVENQIQLKAGELDDKVREEVALYAEQLEEELAGIQDSAGKEYLKQILNSQLKLMLFDNADRRQALYEDIQELQSKTDNVVAEKKAELVQKIADFRIEREQLAKTELEEYTSSVVADAEELLANEKSKMEQQLQDFIENAS